MTHLRRVRLAARNPDGSPASLREAVLGVYRGVLDPEEHTLVVVPLIDESSMSSSGAESVSAPASSRGRTDTGAALDKGVDE